MSEEQKTIAVNHAVSIYLSGRLQFDLQQILHVLANVRTDKAPEIVVLLRYV